MVKKKAIELDFSERKTWVDKECRELSIIKQLELLGIAKSSYYYESGKIDEEDLLIKEDIDKLYTKHPYYGSRRMRVELQKLGWTVGRKRTSRLMSEMGINAQYPKPNLSKPNKAHKKYPYLLKGVVPIKPNQVWSADITYIPLDKGFLYLMAVIDWYSRKVISWRLSNTLDTRFCVEALEEALQTGFPEIFNTDQGVQFTSEEFIKILEDLGIKISMDGKGRALDNIFIERFWRSLKYEDIYIKRYESGKEAHIGIKLYIEFYNYQRPHQSLGYKTPHEIHEAA